MGVAQFTLQTLAHQPGPLAIDLAYVGHGGLQRASLISDPSEALAMSVDYRQRRRLRQSRWRLRDAPAVPTGQCPQCAPTTCLSPSIPQVPRAPQRSAHQVEYYKVGKNSQCRVRHQCGRDDAPPRHLRWNRRNNQGRDRADRPGQG